jgi:hypothetical protein
MRALATALLVAATWTAARAGGVDVDAFVPIDPHEHERLHFFDGRGHHLVPGTVSIDGKPYVCDPDGKTFREQDEFVAHLRSAHRVAPEDVSDRIAVHGGKVHFIKR